MCIRDRDSITSQLFPSRTTGRNPEEKKGWKSRVLHGKRAGTTSPSSAPSPFRKDYSLDSASETASYNFKKSASGNPAPPMCIAAHASAEDSSSLLLRDHLAELSLQNSESQAHVAASPAPLLQSPGPSSPVVQSTKQEALFEQLSSMTSLKKMLVEGRIGDQINAPPSSIDIPRRPSVAVSDTYMSDDGDDEESLLQGVNDVVINNSMLENAMKRKRSSRKNKALGASCSSRETMPHSGLKKLKPLEPASDRINLPSFSAMHARPCLLYTSRCV